MIEVPITDVPTRLPELLERACDAGERVFLTQDGRRVAALVSAVELRLLEAERDDAVEQDIERARHAHEEIGIPLSEVRAGLQKPKRTE